MTDKQQNLAVALSIGWKCRGIHHKGGIPHSLLWYNPEGSPKNGVPNYTIDLNAISQVVVLLDEKQRQTYLAHLGWTFDMTADEVWELVNSSPAKCTKAYLKTIGKWKTTN